jgi:hypothetical protein
MRTTSRLQIGDTAECNSALRWQWQRTPYGGVATVVSNCKDRSLSFELDKPPHFFGCVAEFVGKRGGDLMFSVIGWRAYSQGRSESVTRGDRRRCELEFESPSPPLARPCE